MTTIVTALMYSGKQDPSWELTSEQAKQLKEILSEKREVTMEMSALSFGLLGYRGFIIESYEPSIPSKAFCFDGIIDLIDQRHANFIDKDSSLESFLLQTGIKALTESEKSFISTEISKNSKGGPASKNRDLKSTMDLLTVPPFDPGKWNIASVQRFNNCYNYANDIITNTFAQPGKGSGQMYNDISCAEVSSAAKRDGQISVMSASSTPLEGHFIALVIAPDYDYHWYRLDSNGKWSHKPGQTPAKNTDNNGQLITDPKTCSKYPYTEFCGLFHCKPDKVQIR